MRAHTSTPPEYIRQTESYMEALKAAVRAHPSFAGLTSEAEIEQHKGEAFARHSVCHSRWELQGPQGSLTVEANFANSYHTADAEASRNGKRPILVWSSWSP
jgi:hypothetical protein